MTCILAIETSCDETGVAIVRDGCHIEANYVASQLDLHAEFGGVVPEIASREHTRIIAQMVGKALSACGNGIDAVAATRGPGLFGSLLVGVCFAKAFAFARGVPFIPVHHIEGHLFSPFLNGEPPRFPFLALVVSGGHTLLVHCEKQHTYHVLGTTRDDAVGEAFDKVARLLNLPYPGGPSIQHEAEHGNPDAFAFPQAFAGTDSLEFSFSGLKTAVLYALQKDPEAFPADVAASFQHAAVQTLVSKVKLALERTGAPMLAVVGGVAANRLLRERLLAEIDVPVSAPPLVLCTDNAAMIGAAAFSHLENCEIGSIFTVPVANLPLNYDNPARN